MALYGAVALVLSGESAAADAFSAWLDDFRSEARARGIAEATLDAAFDGVRPIPRVVELDRRQAEGRMSLVTYLDRVVNPTRVARGREMLRRHGDVLAEVAARYGVPARFIVALWGVETTYGSYTGDFAVIDALATLAYDGRRAELFRGELLAALQVLDAGEVEPDRLKGSWAGAMGQSQFMPSSYVRYAVDFDGDGRRDIWTSLPDVFASIANYLHEAGWRPGETWGRQVEAPASLPDGLDQTRTLAEWQAVGVRRVGGGDLPDAPLSAALIRPDGTDGPAFLVYHNFRVLMRWNRSTYFATSVGRLADRLRS